MKEQLISHKTAELAKEKGFIWEERVKEYDYKEHHWILTKFPTQSLLQRWLREEHDIHVEIRVIYDTADYSWSIIKINPYDVGNNSVYDRKLSFKEALEKGLQEALKLIE